MGSTSNAACRLRMRAIPSVLDPLVTGDTWLSPCNDECLVLYLNNKPMHALEALPVDQPSLNNRLFEIRNRSR